MHKYLKKNNKIIVDCKINTIHGQTFFQKNLINFVALCRQNLGLFFLVDLEQKRTNLFIIWSAALAIVANRTRKYNPLLVITIKH